MFAVKQATKVELRLTSCTPGDMQEDLTGLAANVRSGEAKTGRLPAPGTRSSRPGVRDKESTSSFEEIRSIQRAQPAGPESCARFGGAQSRS
jgi:hypothetical protein